MNPYITLERLLVETRPSTAIRCYSAMSPCHDPSTLQCRHPKTPPHWRGGLSLSLSESAIIDFQRMTLITQYAEYLRRLISKQKMDWGMHRS
jgi:hypothetical protein